jgi:membrane associated rhomboid family serine protease
MLAIPLRDDTLLQRAPVVTYGLIAACVGIHVWLSGLSPRVAERVIRHFGMTPAFLLHTAHFPTGAGYVPPYLSLFTSMFLHGGWLHLAGNMLYLWLFGRGVETAMGPARFLGFYFIAGLSGERAL